MDTAPEKASVVIERVTQDTIVLKIDGQPREIPNNPDALHELLQGRKALSLQTADKIYNIGSINHATFQFIVGQSQHANALPADLASNLITEDNYWVESLRQEIRNQGVVVGNTTLKVFQHFGWLIEVFLQKMETEVGKERTLRRLAFMAEAFQGTLRFLCYVQLTQLLQRDHLPANSVIADFFQMNADQHAHCDYLILLLTTTQLLGPDSFMPEINRLVAEISTPGTDLNATALFLEKRRDDLLKNAIPGDLSLNHVLDEYLTALVAWLRELAFLAKYRLISMKDINLRYQLGTPKNFVHVYGELHGMFTDAEGMDYNEYTVPEAFTYNQSVLLFKGSEMGATLKHIHLPNTFISLSPLVIDQSVYAAKPTQTPEIYYYIGQAAGKRDYRFAQYKNELPYGGEAIPSNKELLVARQNMAQPKLNELHAQLDQMLKAFIPSAT